jgi:hypothetical protein
MDVNHLVGNSYKWIERPTLTGNIGVKVRAMIATALD